MKKYIAVFAVLGLLLTACKKNNTYYGLLDPELKRNFSFKPGSYWIYRDSLSGRIDSFFVSAIAGGKIESRTKTDEQIAISITQCGAGQADSAHWALLLCDSHITRWSYYGTASGKQLKNANADVPYPFVQSGAIDLFAQLTIGGACYNNVASCCIITGDTPADTSRLFIKEDVGLVKICLNADTVHAVWELQRYHINY